MGMGLNILSGGNEEDCDDGDKWLDMSGVIAPTWLDSNYGSKEKLPSSNFVADAIQKLLRAELANPGAKRKQGPVILRDPSNPSNSVNLDDLVPGHLGGYKAPLVRREFGVNEQAVKSREKGGKPLARREYRDTTEVKGRKIGGIPQPTVMLEKLRAALRAVLNEGNR